MEAESSAFISSFLDEDERDLYDGTAYLHVYVRCKAVFGVSVCKLPPFQRPINVIFKFKIISMNKHEVSFNSQNFIVEKITHFYIAIKSIMLLIYLLFFFS